MEVRNQEVNGLNVGGGYLCGLIDASEVQAVAGPEAVRVLDGSTCVISSTDGPKWVTAAQGRVQGRLAFAEPIPQQPDTTIAGLPVVVDEPVNAKDRSYRSGVIATPGGAQVRVQLEVTQVPAAERADQQWRSLAGRVAAAIQR